MHTKYPLTTHLTEKYVLLLHYASSVVGMSTPEHYGAIGWTRISGVLALDVDLYVALTTKATR